MVKEEACSFEDVVKRIATKGGTTEAGLNILSPEVIAKSLEACMQKAYENVSRLFRSGEEVGFT